MQPFPSFSVGQDAYNLFAVEKKAFEDASGWNDTSRGSYTGDPSGGAILAVREQLERTFAPGVNAAARAITEWGKIQLHMMRWGYDMPRTIAMLGDSRPDLGVVLSRETFDGISQVQVDPETLMPMPRSLRLLILDELYAKGLVSGQEYRRRLPFGWTRNLETPDTDHHARAKRVCEAIRRTGRADALPINWQDNEAIHQDVLERELILPDDLDPAIKQAAQARWVMLAQQAAMKAGMMAPPPEPTGGGKKDGKSKRGAGLDPREQPFAGTSPYVAAGTAAQMAGETDEQRAGVTFDQMQPL